MTMVVAVSAFGLLIGSFLNVVAHRLPRGASLVTPGSACPSCATPLRPWHNVPVLSWVALRGRCGFCAVPISARYPLVELATALLWAAVAAVHHGETAQLALGLLLVTAAVPVALIDAEHMIIPNRITLPTAIAAVAIGLALDPSGQPERLLAAAIAGGVFLLIVLLAPRGMGMGDAKLVAVLGLLLGAPVAVAILVALVAGTVVGVVIMARLGVVAGRKTKVPFGIFLALGGVVAALAGQPLLELYTSTFA
jgi:leader peptidase (prepilin peptidase) / N-methyltransferase